MLRGNNAQKSIKQAVNYSGLQLRMAPKDIKCFDPI